MAMVTHALLTALFTAFRKDFQDGIGLAESQWEKLATFIQSTSASNTYGWLGQFPKLREWVGSRVVKSMKAQAYQIVNDKYEGTVGILRTDIEDDNLGVYSPLMQEMGRAAMDQRNDIVFDLVKNGDANECYDGQFFFDDEHPVYPNVDGTGDAVLVANQSIPAENPGEPWYLLDTSRVLKPFIFQERTAPELESKVSAKDSDHVFTEDQYLFGVRTRCAGGYAFWQLAYKSRQPLTAENYAAARAAMRAFKADGGRKLDVKPNVLLVPTTLETQGRDILLADRIEGSSNVWKGTAELVVAARLTD